MSGFDCTIRSYRPSDFGRIIRLLSEAKQIEPDRSFISSVTLAERLARPNFSPEEHLLIVEVDEEIVGYIEITPELGIGRTVFDCLVHPRRRRRGVASRLLTRAMKRSGTMGARIAHVSVDEAANAGKALLSYAGFRFVRRFIEMRLDFYNAHLTRVKEGPFSIRKLQFEESEKLTEIQNRSFAGSWGFNPNTDEEIRYRLALHGCGPEDVIMAYTGQRPVAYCWTRTLLQADGTRKGEIHMLGVDPDFRNQDIGREILLRGLLDLKRRGLGLVDLTVDEENHAARQLYESLGFRIHRATVWYEKRITR